MEMELEHPTQVELEAAAKVLGWLELKKRMAEAGVSPPAGTEVKQAKRTWNKGKVQEFCRDQSKSRRAVFGKLVTRDWWIEFCQRYDFPAPIESESDREVLWDADEVERFWDGFDT